MLASTATAVTAATALGALLPLLEIELPWDPPSLTQLAPMTLFVALLIAVFVGLVVLYFYEPTTGEN